MKWWCNYSWMLSALFKCFQLYYITQMSTRRSDSTSNYTIEYIRSRANHTRWYNVHSNIIMGLAYANLHVCIINTILRQLLEAAMCPVTQKYLPIDNCTCNYRHHGSNKVAVQVWNKFNYILFSLGQSVVPSPFLHEVNTVKPVCNDHLYNKIYYLWFIQ